MLRSFLMIGIGLGELLVLGILTVPLMAGGFCVWYFALRKPKQ